MAPRAKVEGSDQIEKLISFVQRELRSRADPARAAAMAAYMKTSMPFYGVAKPDRDLIHRELKKQFSISTHKDYQRAVLGLWRLPHREEKYFALAIAQTRRDFIVPASLPLYRRMIVEGAWWDFVDEVASHLVGSILLHHRKEIAPTMDQWIKHKDMWLRRAAIISQLSHKDRTDHARLFRYCLAQASDSEFFIRKAIGWALRQYGYSAPEKVREFIIANRRKLSPLSYLEASRVLIKQGLMHANP